MKKLLLSSLMVLLLAVVVAGTAFAAPAADRQLLLKGSIQSQETYSIDFPIMSVNATGSGTATQLGQFNVTYQVAVNLLTVSGPGSIQFVAANGDSLFGQGSGQASDTGTPGVFNVVETYTITGGTGRFAGASGSITLDRIVDTNTGVTSGTMSGAILLP
ncbi:MAG: hypothetical protein ACM3XO_03690 [Bacteroidota bacterium]|jgi:hypothetical protein